MYIDFRSITGQGFRYENHQPIPRPKQQAYLFCRAKCYDQRSIRDNGAAQYRRSIDQCMQIMTDKHIRHLPIVNDSQVLGLISIGDVVREMIAYQKSMIEQLQSYIAG